MSEPKKHDFMARKTPVGWFARCSCGFSRSGNQRNALAKASKINAACNEHGRLVAAEKAGEE